MLHLLLPVLHLVAEFLGVAVFFAVMYAGVHAIARHAITKTSDTLKNAMAAKHVKQAINEFKANHPDIAAMYTKK